MATIRGVKLPEGVHLEEVLFEIQTVGRTARVVAVDLATNTEIVMVGDPSYGEETLKRLAIRKLAFVIAKNLCHRQKAEGGARRRLTDLAAFDTAAPPFFLDIHLSYGDIMRSVKNPETSPHPGRRSDHSNAGPRRRAAKQGREKREGSGIIVRLVDTATGRRFRCRAASREHYSTAVSGSY